ncbi:MAG TPA: helix-turn-helix transcriptional regulator [Actinomycetota bacterium]|nr:helix-turn-helix transcriptional regulator [Actinomycetota bacterium]
MTAWAGNLIRIARHRQALSQRELARRAGTSQAAIAAYESGRRSPTLDTLSRIVRAAGLDLRVRMEPLDDHDDFVRRYEAALPADVVAAWRRRDRELVEQARRERRPATRARE